MSNDDFKKLYQQEFTAHERTDLVWQLAKEYYERCDRYDETVCTGRREGESVPATEEEFRLINLNAIKVLRELQERAEIAGFTKQDLREAMHEYITKTKK